MSYGGAIVGINDVAECPFGMIGEMLKVLGEGLGVGMYLWLRGACGAYGNKLCGAVVYGVCSD